MKNAKLIAEKLNNAQLKFIEDEFNLDAEKFRALEDDELDALYDEIGLIEADEIINADDENRELAERGVTAADIVTLIGNELY